MEPSTSFSVRKHEGREEMEEEQERQPRPPVHAVEVVIEESVEARNRTRQLSQQYLQYSMDNDGTNTLTDPESQNMNAFALYPPHRQLIISAMQGLIFTLIGACFLVMMASRFSVGLLPLLIFEILAVSVFICIHVGLYRLLILRECRDGQNVSNFRKYWKLFALGDHLSTLFQFLAMCIAFFLCIACKQVSWQSHYKSFFHLDDACMELEHVFLAEVVLGLIRILVNVLRPLFFRFSCLWTIYEKTYRYPLKWLVCSLTADFLPLSLYMIVLRDVLPIGHLSELFALFLCQVFLTISRWFVWVSTSAQAAMEGVLAWLAVLVHIAAYVIFLLQPSFDDRIGMWSSIWALCTSLYLIRAWCSGGMTQCMQGAVEGLERSSGVTILLVVFMFAPQYAILVVVLTTDSSCVEYLQLSQALLQTLSLFVASLLYCEIALKWESGQRRYNTQDPFKSWSYYAQATIQMICGVGGLEQEEEQEQRESKRMTWPAYSIPISRVISFSFLACITSSLMWNLLHFTACDRGGEFRRQFGRNQGQSKDNTHAIESEHISPLLTVQNIYVLSVYGFCVHKTDLRHVISVFLYALFPCWFLVLFYEADVYTYVYDNTPCPAWLVLILSVSLICWCSATWTFFSRFARVVLYGSCAVAFFANLYVIFFEEGASIWCATAVNAIQGCVMVICFFRNLPAGVMGFSMKVCHVANIALSFACAAFSARGVNLENDWLQLYDAWKLYFVHGCCQLILMLAYVAVRISPPSRLKKCALLSISFLVVLGDIALIICKNRESELRSNVLFTVVSGMNFANLWLWITMALVERGQPAGGREHSLPEALVLSWCRPSIALMTCCMCTNAVTFAIAQLGDGWLVQVEIALSCISNLVIVGYVASVCLQDDVARVFIFVAHILHGLSLTILGLRITDSHFDDNLDSKQDTLVKALHIVSAAGWFLGLCIWGIVSFWKRSESDHVGPETNVLRAQLGCKILMHAFGIMWLIQELQSSENSLEKSILVVCLLVHTWLFAWSLSMTEDFKSLWSRLFLSQVLCCTPPLGIQFIFKSHVGNAFTSALMSGELLFLINGFGFDQVIHSKHHIPERPCKQQALRLLPTILFMSVTWVLNAISLYIDSRVLVYHLALGCAASLCTNLFSAYFFITEQSGWPASRATILLENSFASILMCLVCVHAYYMRICLISELPLVQWAFSIHVLLVISLMFCRSWFRTDWKNVPRRLWIPNFLLETADLASIFALYYGADADEVWYSAFLFAEFCFNLIIFETGQNFWKTDYLVGLHVFIFDLVSDIPLILIVLYRIVSTGHNVLEDEVAGVPVQAISFVVNILILVKSVLAQPIWWWLQDDDDVYYPRGRRPREDEQEEESYENTDEQADDDQDGGGGGSEGDLAHVVRPDDSSSGTKILAGVQAVKLSVIGIVLSVALTSFAIPGRISSTLLIQANTSSGASLVTFLPNKMLFKSVIETEMSDLSDTPTSSLRYANIRMKGHEEFVIRGVRKENASLVLVHFDVLPEQLNGTVVTAIQQNFGVLVDSGRLLSALASAGIELTRACFLIRPHQVYLQGCEGKNTGAECGDGNDADLDGCTDSCQTVTSRHELSGSGSNFMRT